MKRGARGNVSPFAPAKRFVATLLGPLGVGVVSLALTGSAGCARQGNERPAAEPRVSDAPPPRDPDDGPRYTRIDYPVPEAFYGVRVSDGVELSPDELLSELAQASAVCVGERHDDPHHHWAQYRVLSELIERRAMSGRELALGLEMVPVSGQSALSRWSRRDTRTKQALQELDWNETWGYDFGLYAPLWRLARAHQVELIALNVPRELTRKIAQGGLRSLSRTERRALPQRMHLGDREHRQAFDQAMVHHPAPPAGAHSGGEHGGHLDHYYEAQVTWDEGMAEQAAAWLTKRQPARQMLILAGTAHCQDSAIPRRLRRRAAEATTASVRPWHPDEGVTLAAVVETKRYDYVIALTEAP
ncbi:MAG: ChaN family lipoprotein [Polyangiaceae bacterium]|nr:ChaN family lipoprotein [Polyangiaceae bacterium]MCW5791172.1 ChaN family lipoprotein [Polyangiaceae bacterium]